VDALRASELWAPIVGDAEASLGDLRAISRYDFSAERFRGLRVPVLLQTGSESPRELYVTDALAAALPDARIGTAGRPGARGHDDRAGAVRATR
jgi:hypothetical protein